jgi:hypothetical protein
MARCPIQLSDATLNRASSVGAQNRRASRTREQVPAGIAKAQKVAKARNAVFSRERATRAIAFRSVSRFRSSLSARSVSIALELWAGARRSGQPTADPKALDGDVILAAQVEQVGGIVATDNARHLSRYVEAREWREIS